MPDGVDQLRAGGTSLLIVAFRDPDSEEGIEPAAVLEKIAKAAATNFWYLMVLNRLKVTVEHIVDGQREFVTNRVDHLGANWRRAFEQRAGKGRIPGR